MTDMSLSMGPATGLSREGAAYDAIALEYSRIDGQTVFRDLVLSNHAQELGDLSGQRVLDLACGAGASTRLLNGAREIVGVDESEGMIQQAQRQTNDPRYNYLVRKVGTDDLRDLGHFDTVSSVFILNYAKTREEMRAMYDAAASVLPIGGKFVATVPSPLTPDVDTLQYGMTAVTTKPIRDGSIRTATLHPRGADSFSFDTVYWSQETYFRQAARAGFVLAKTQPTRVPTESSMGLPAGYLDAYRRLPQHVTYTFLNNGDPTNR